MLMSRAVPVAFHDTWAGVLMALALALRQPGRYGASMVAALAAVLFRELALALIVLMAVCAAYERQWREMVGWGAVLLVAVVGIGLHAAALLPLRHPADLSSQGWGGLGGWSYAVAAVRETSGIGLLPLAAEFVVVPLSLFGWLSWKSPVALRVSGMLLGYLLALMIFARPENFYWALMIAPLLLGGLGLAPAALFALVKRCRPLARGIAKRPSMGAAT